MASNAVKNYRSAKAVQNIRNAAIYVVLVILSLIWIIPFVYLLGQSFASTYVAKNFLPGLTMNFKTMTFGFDPSAWTFENYVHLFNPNSAIYKAYPFAEWYFNTFIIALVTTVLQTILVLLTAYTLSRLRFTGRQALMKLILVIGMFPGFLGMIVVYNLLKLLGLNTSIFSLILVYIAGSAMNYYIAKGFFDTISRSLDEAVMIDGGTNNTIFWRVIMPLSKPIVVYTILISFTAPWGDYMLACFLAQGNSHMWNVAVGLRTMITTLGNEWSHMPIFCAGGVVVSIPIMILFFWLQKYYVQGIAGGAVKG